MSAKLLSVYSFVPTPGNASYYYRIMVPLLTAEKLGLPLQMRIDTHDSRIDDAMRIQAQCESDILLLYQPVGDTLVHNIRTAKAFVPSKRDGEWKYPPTVIVETDDNLFNVNPHNQAYAHLGIRDHEGRDIPVGNQIGVVQDGVKKILWQDGHKGFDLARNRHNLATYRTMIETADAVTTTSRHIKARVLDEAKPRRIEVFPNLVRFDHYPTCKLAEEPDKIKILWQGGASHYEDWYQLKQALGSITKKYPQVHWIIWGMIYHWVTELIPPDRFTYLDWVPYENYKDRRVMIGEDINLAPLNDNRFNVCRSAIKFYEATTSYRPAPTLAQRTGPYADEIIDGETGLLFNTPDEFESQLSVLIENVAERKRLASNAKDWVSENRDAFKHVPKLIAFWEELRENAKKDTPHMPDVDWDKFMVEVDAQEAADKEQSNTEELERANTVPAGTSPQPLSLALA